MGETTPDDKINSIRQRLAALDEERAALASQLRDLERAVSPASSLGVSSASITNASSSRDKIALFRRLFGGRTDVFPARWTNRKTGKSGYAPACANEWVRGICGKPKMKCSDCPNQNYILVSDAVIECHLRGEDNIRPNGRGGDFVVGVYPLLFDDTCGFLAVDFDGDNWVQDSQAYIDTCRAEDVPASLERSRSGNGGHVWIFFSEPVAASEARRLGTLLLTKTMNGRPEVGFASYDRFFPSQDTMPRGGFGNLIALPLQRRARERGNSLFIDDELQPFPDQWAFLSSVKLMRRSDVEALLNKSSDARGGLVGVRLPVDDDNADEPWQNSPSRRSSEKPTEGPLPANIDLIIADQVYIDRHNLPPALIAKLLRIAAFQNPEFYRAQAMRLPTFGKPRVISCAELYTKHVALPRGCLDEVRELFVRLGVDLRLNDKRESGSSLDVQFLGTLYDEQLAAVAALQPHDCGVLAATTAFGKTVVGAKMIALRQCNTLVLVHRRQLVEQWRERLKSFLSVEDSDIGMIGGGRRKPTGRIDVALIQSLVRKGEVSDLVADYGHLIVDECHHLSAVSFELVARRAKARYVLGLSATIARKDGHQPIIFMQCGPVRYKVDAKSQASRRSFLHKVRLQETGFQMQQNLEPTAPLQMTALFAALASNEQRNELIFDDVLKCLDAGRRPVVLTERRDHLELLRARFAPFTKNLVVMYGGMKAGDRRAAQTGLEVADGTERLVLATGRYLGEGFDDASLDTLFLTMPISWRGTLAQYVGRLHRDHHAKREVIVFDYIDSLVPTLSRMAQKRQAGYRALGYTIDDQ